MFIVDETNTTLYPQGAPQLNHRSEGVWPNAIAEFFYLRKLNFKKTSFTRHKLLQSKDWRARANYFLGFLIPFSSDVISTKSGNNTNCCNQKTEEHVCNFVKHSHRDVSKHSSKKPTH